MSQFPYKSDNPTDGVNQVERDQERIMDEVLGELYVFLLKETNCVLNLIYTETIIDRYNLFLGIFSYVGHLHIMIRCPHTYTHTRMHARTDSYIRRRL